MKMAKKAFSLVLALVMLVNVFAVMGSALGSASAIDLYLSSDKDTYAAGEEITLTVSAQVTDEVIELLLGNQLALAFDSSVVEPYSTSTTLSAHGMTALQSAYSDSESQVIFEDVINTAFTNDIIRAEDKTAYGWDTRIMYCVADADATVFVNCEAKTALFQVKMKVKADAAPGTYTIGFNYNSYDNGNGYVQDAYGPVDNVAKEPYYSSDANYSFTHATFTVAAPAPAYELAVTPLKNQIRYNKNADGSFKDINVRARASIDAAEIQALLGVSTVDEVEDAIVEAGFVFGTSLNAVTAKDVAEGASASGYTKKTVEYMQNTGSAYVYTCLVSDITDDKIVAASDFAVYAYITLNIGGTEYTFCYEDVTTASPLGMYNSTYERANTTYGWSLAAK